jgi:hypothetical protein
MAGAQAACSTAVTAHRGCPPQASRLLSIHQRGSSDVRLVKHSRHDCHTRCASLANQLSSTLCTERSRAPAQGKRAQRSRHAVGSPAGPGPGPSHRAQAQMRRHSPGPTPPMATTGMLLAATTAASPATPSTGLFLVFVGNTAARQEVGGMRHQQACAAAGGAVGCTAAGGGAWQRGTAISSMPSGQGSGTGNSAGDQWLGSSC